MSLISHSFVYDLDSGDFSQTALNFPTGYDHDYTLELRKGGEVYELPTGSIIELFFDRINPVNVSAPIIHYDTASFGLDSEGRYTNTFDTTRPELNNLANVEGAFLRIVDDADGEIYELSIQVNFRNASLPPAVSCTQSYNDSSVPREVANFVRALLSWDNIQNKPPLTESSIVSLSSLIALFDNLDEAQKRAFTETANIPRVEFLKVSIPEGQSFAEFPLEDIEALGATKADIVGGSIERASSVAKHIGFNYVDTTGINPRIFGDSDAKGLGENNAILLLRIL